MAKAQILNVGWARAASTALRANFLARHADIALVDQRQDAAEGPGSSLLPAIKRASDAEFDRRSGALHAQWTAHRPKAAGQVLCVSDEELSIGLPRTGILPAGIAARCARVFPNSGILAVVRNQIEAIRSFHKRAMMVGTTAFVPLPHWVDRYFLRPKQGEDYSYLFDYGNTLRAYLAHSPLEDVCVTPVESLRRDPLATYRHISRWMGVSEALCEDLPTCTVNASPSIAFLRARYGNAGANPPGANHRDESGDAPSPDGYGDEQESQLRARYGAGNRALASALGIDLAGWGYPV